MVEYEVSLVKFTGCLTCFVCLRSPHQLAVAELRFSPSITLILIGISATLTINTDVIAISKILIWHRLRCLFVRHRPSYFSIINGSIIPVGIGLGINLNPICFTPVRQFCIRFTWYSEGIDGQLRFTAESIIPIALKTWLISEV